MPEGPEVKTVAKTLGERLVGQKLGRLWHSDLRLRRAVDYGALKRLEHAMIDEVSAYGKVLFMRVQQKTAIVAQLGMTGQLHVMGIDEPVLPHTHVRWPLCDSRFELRYVDPRRFGLIDACDEDEKCSILAKLGPDPFYLEQKDFRPLIDKMRCSTRAIKERLLDQSVIAGVGNIYASEALFKAGIHPERSAASLLDHEANELLGAVIETLKKAYENAGTTFSNYVDGSGKKGQNQAFLQVFQRDGLPCFRCKTLIERCKQGGRSTFFCARCQA